MKKITLLLAAIFMSVFQLCYAQSFCTYIRSGSWGSPWKNYYVGDKMDVFEFAFNPNGYLIDDITVEYAMGKSMLGNDYTWFAAEFIKKEGNNYIYKSRANEHVLINEGKWYYIGRFLVQSNGYIEYADNTYNTWICDNTTIGPDINFVQVNKILPPTNTVALRTVEDLTSATISWVKNQADHNVMLVRFEADKDASEPVQGMEYTTNGDLGAGKIVYIGNDDSFNDAALNNETGYKYKLYSVNNNYYSAGVLLQTTATHFTWPASKNVANQPTAVYLGNNTSFSCEISGSPAQWRVVLSKSPYLSDEPNLTGDWNTVVEDDVCSATTTMFNEIGAYYWGIEVKYEGDDNSYWHCDSKAEFQDMLVTPYSGLTLNVNPVAAPTYRGIFRNDPNRVELKWNKNAAGNDVIVVRFEKGQPFTEPAHGVEYDVTINNTIGAGIVVYKGNGTEHKDFTITRGTEYEYKCYSVNNNYYSEGLLMQVPNPANVTAVRDSENLATVVLSWSQVGNNTNLLIVRYEKGQTVTDPRQEQTYEPDNELGNGVVVAALSREITTFTDSELDAEKEYQYVIYSEYYKCYSEGLIITPLTAVSVIPRSSNYNGKDLNHFAWYPSGVIYQGDDCTLGFKLDAADIAEWKWRYVLNTNSNLSKTATISAGEWNAPLAAGDRNISFVMPFTGTVYWGFEVEKGSENYWHCANDKGLKTMKQSPVSQLTLYVLPLLNPRNPVVSLNESNPYTAVNLVWTPDPQNHQVMIVKSKPLETITPQQGKTYSVNDVIGEGSVIYKGYATSFTDIDLNPDTEYLYTFFTANNGYYSQGIPLSVKTAIANEETNSTDYFRTAVSGNWNNELTWFSSADGIVWSYATQPPGNEASLISIQPECTVAFSDNIELSSLKLDGTLEIVSGAFSLNQVEINGNLIINKGAEFVMLGELHDATVNGKIQVKVPIETNKWSFLGFPFNIKAVLDVNGTPLTPDVDYAAAWYDCHKRAQGRSGWTPVTTGTYEAGTGYIFMIADHVTNSTLVFEASGSDMKNALVTSHQKQLNYPTHEGGANNNAGWNFITHHMPVNATCSLADGEFHYAYDSGTDTYLTSTESVDYVSAFDAYFIKTASTGDVLFEACRATPFLTQAMQTKEKIELYLGDNKKYKTTIRIRPEATTGYDELYDAPYCAGMRSETPQIYTRVNAQVTTAINSVPAGATIPMEIKVPAAGQYIIHWDVNLLSRSATLFDKVADKLVDMQSFTSYGFETESAGVLTERFLIILTDDFIIGNHWVTDNFKVYTLNQTMVIEGDKEISAIKIFDITGKCIYSANQSCFRHEAPVLTNFCIVEFNYDGKPQQVKLIGLK